MLEHLIKGKQLYPYRMAKNLEELHNVKDYPDKIHFYLPQIITYSQSDLHLWHYQSSTNSICIQRADRRMKTRSDQEEEEVSKVLKRRGAPRKSKPPECPPKTRKTYKSND